MRLVNRNGIWHVHYYDGKGELQRESTHVSDKIAAKRIGLAKERTASASAGKEVREPFTVDQAVTYCLKYKQFKTEETRTFYKQKLAQISRLLGTFDVNDLTVDDVREYINTREGESSCLTKDKPVKPHTIHKELGCFRLAMGMIGEHFHGNLDKLFPDYDPMYKPRETFLTAEEFARLMPVLCVRAMPALLARRQLWCSIACYLGARKSEVEGLEWTDLDFTKGVDEEHDGIAHLRGTKTTKSNRWVPIPKALGEILKAIRQPSGLIVGLWRNATSDLEEACERAKVPRVTANDLRRTYASWLIQRGVSNRLVADLLGHTTTIMVDKVYGKTNLDAMRRATATLAADSVKDPPYTPPTAPPADQKQKSNQQFVYASRFHGIEVD